MRTPPVRVLLAAVLAAGGAIAPWQAAQPAQAAPHAPPARGPAPLPAGKSWKVTLLTGDVVEVSTRKGRPPLVRVEPGKGRRPTFDTSISRNGHVIVVPSDVARLAGPVLDPALFDVTALIRQGYDDARSADIPLIVQGGKSARVQGFAAARELRSLRAVAARQPKKRAVALGRSLLSAGPTRVWLDRKVRTTATTAARDAPRSGLDRNLPQIGAPAAWQAGFTGTGATVAVLDTGIDETHPDLRDRVAEKKDFVGTTDAEDGNGHGTHVAATVAGSGAGAGGERRGVAPDARLVVGKVLENDGSGTESVVIEGMEWAASRAKIVNMSLGGDATDGTDPLSAAVDRLTAKHGTLFVVSAGNNGGTGTVGSPATADTALAVGAVDGSDRIAPFSSGGPRTGRTAAKPEITAPGVDIIAARAARSAEGRPIDDRYSLMSGTSMAAPHVAGAAALLLQKHPGWKSPQLKAALVGASRPIGGDVLRQGAGRLDAAAAVSAPLTALDSVPHAGTSAYPGRPALTARPGFASTGQALTAELSVQVTDRTGKVRPGAAKLAETRLNVPANGQARASLTIDAAALKDEPGFYTAHVTARSGDATARVPVTFQVEPPSHTLTIVGKALPDTTAFSGRVAVTSLNAGTPVEAFESLQAPDEPLRMRVPAGRYSVLGTVQDGEDEAPGTRHALGGAPEVKVDRDVTVTIDGTKAKEAAARVEGRETTPGGPTAVVAVQGDGDASWARAITTFAPDSKVYVQPSGPASTGTFRTWLAVRLTAPGTVWDLMEPLGDRLPDDPSFTVTPAVQKRLARVDQRFAAFNGDTAKAVWEKRQGVLPEGVFANEDGSEVKPGSTRTDYLSAGDGRLWLDASYPGLELETGDGPTVWAELEPLTQRVPGSRVTKTWGSQAQHPGFIAPGLETLSILPVEPASRTRGLMRFQVFDLQSRPDIRAGFVDVEPSFDRKTALYENGRKVGEKLDNIAEFKVGEQPASYRLTYENDLSRLLPVANRTSTAWTFRSSGADAGRGVAHLPMLQVQYDLGLDLMNRPTGAPATFSVARVAGTGSAKVTGLTAWTSLDGGAKWRPAEVRSLGGGRFSAVLPKPGAGQRMTLRVSARDAGGSGIDQTLHGVY
ncbi:S8 family serine peptidase [Spirillospora sp. NPDC127200]